MTYYAIIVGVFNTPSQLMFREKKQKYKNFINIIPYHLYQPTTNSTLRPIAAGYNHCPNACEASTETEHML